MSDTDAAELGRQIVELFMRHGGGMLNLSHHAEMNDTPATAPDDIYTACFIGSDGKRMDLSRYRIASTVAALVGREKRKTCRACRLTKSADCFSKNLPGLCLMCAAARPKRKAAR